MKTHAILAILAISNWGALSAQEFQGAEAVLKRVADAAAAKPVEEKKADPASELRSKLLTFQKESDSMPPEKAASQWLALLEAVLAMPRNDMDYSYGNEEGVNLTLAFRSLPHPGAWPALDDAIKKRKGGDNMMLNAGYRLLAAVLNHGPAEMRKEVEALRKSLEVPGKPGTYKNEMHSYMMQSLEEQIQTLLATDQEKVAALEKQIAEAGKADGNEQRRMMQRDYFNVPDLVKISGEAKATAILERLLPIAEEISFEGDATRRLAAKLALKHVAKLKKPLWDLVESQEDIVLFEALAKQFPPGEDDHERESAESVYLVSLVAANRVEEATKFAQELAKRAKREFSISSSELDAMRERGFGKQFLAFLRELLSADPKLPLWSSFIELSASEGSASEALAFLRSTIAKPGLDENSRAVVQGFLATALLAADEVDEGISVLRALVAMGPKQGAGAAAKDPGKDIKAKLSELGVDLNPEQAQSLEAQSDDAYEKFSEHMQLALTLAKLGHMLQRPELIEEGFAAARTTYGKVPQQGGLRSGFAERISRALLEAGRGASAEALMLDAMEEIARPASERTRFHGPQAMADPLATLAEIYQKSGRAKDVLLLLDRSPMWGASDLSELSPSSNNRLLVVIAKALAQEGRKEDAAKVVRRALQITPGNDVAYELLISLGGNDLEAYMDELYLRDRFEERPLIWKAKLQFDAGKLAEAEKTIRAAIAVDPSDGEQGKGDRMRAYAVLGDILEKKGDAAQAKIMRGAVAAIRLSENADDWWNAGMLSRAVKMYEEALNLFADAYCIQSRLALRYSELGDFEKAEQHYQRAYELMPESFGRVESHCFGCEGAFSGKRAQNIADKVFTRLAQKMPDRAQVFYLLGYLREQQQRYEEAAANYRKAVTLDPDYLNAWKKLAGLSESASLSAAQRDEAALALLRIDPTGRRGSGNAEQVTDLKKLWAALVAAERSLPREDTSPIYQLTASAMKLESRNDEMGESRRSVQRRRNEDPRDRFVRNPMVAVAIQFIQQSGYNR